MQRRIQELRDYPEQKVDLIFVLDASSSVGRANFKHEVGFVRKLVADFAVTHDAARVAVVTFASKTAVRRQVDHVTVTTPDSQQQQPAMSSAGRDGRRKRTTPAVHQQQQLENEPTDPSYEEDADMLRPNKCSLVNEELPSVTYTGDGATHTAEALREVVVSYTLASKLLLS